jgi:PAS domain S-box-containing protein
MTRIDGAHLLYLPVALACLWLGWRGLMVAVLGGACLIVPHFVGVMPENPLEHDILRTVVLIVVGGTISVLKGRQVKTQRQVRRLHWQLDKSQETSEAEYEILNCRLDRQFRDLRELSEAAQKGNAEKEKILDSLIEQVVYHDQERRVLWANQAFCDRVGSAREAVVGRHCYELWAHGSEPCAECPMAEAMKTGRVSESEKTTEDGRQWFLKGYPITDAQGEVVGGVEVTLDITRRRKAEQEVLEEKRFSESLVSSLPGLFYVLDEEGHLVRWNENLERLSGYSADEVARMHMLDFFAEPEKDLIARTMRDVFTEGQASVEARLRTKSGGSIAFHFTGRQTSQEGERYLVGTGLDITERERARQELQRIFDMSLDIVCVADIDTTTLTRVNPAFGQKLGYTEAELLGRSFQEFIHPEDVDRMTAAMQEEVARGDRVISFENRCRCQNGTYRWLKWTSYPKSEEGLTYAVARDITEAKAAEDALAQERNLLRTVVDNLPDSIYVKDRDSRFLGCNATVLRHHGIEQFEDLEGKTDFDLFAEDVAARFYAEEQEVMDTGRPLLNSERRAEDRVTGELFWHSTTKLPLKNAAGETVGLVGIGRDVTDYRQAQEAYRLLVDSSTQGLVVFQDRHIAFANEAMAEITGYSVDEMLAVSSDEMYEFIHPDDRELVWERHAARLEGAEVEPHYTFRILRKDGSVAWLEIYASRVEYQGQPAVQAACMDVTERVCAENALRESEAQNRGLLDAIPDLIFQVSTDGVFLDCRRGEGQNFCMPSEQFIGKKATEVLPQEVGERFMQTLHQVVEIGQTQTFEYQLSIDGRACDRECRLVRFGHQKILAMIRDITERKGAERLRDLQRDVALELSGVSGLRDGYLGCLETALRFSQMDCGGIYTVDREAGGFHLVAHSGLSEDYVRSVQHIPSDSKSGRLALEGEPIFANHGNLGIPLSPIQRREGLQALAIVPVKYQGQVVACLNIASHTMETVPEWSRMALDMIAAQIGSTVVRLRAEEALRQEHNLVSRITDTSPAGIMLVSRQGRIVFANACAERILGLAKEQITGRAYSAPEWHITDYEGHPLPDEQLPFAIILASGKPVCDLCHAIERPDGTRVLLRVNAAPVFDESGEVAGMVTAIDDVTDKVMAEQSLRESEERFRGVFEHTMLGLYRTTPDGRVLMANPALVRMLGFSSFEELAQRKVDEGYVAREARDLFKQRIEADGQVAGHEAVWMKRDGEPLFVCEHARVVRDASGETLYYEGTVEDVTQRKEADRRLRYRLDFEEVVATISNDFVNLSVDEINSGIVRTLERLGHFVEADRSLVALLDDSGRDFGTVHEWCAEGVASTHTFPEGIDVECFSGAFERVVHTGALNIPRVSDLTGQEDATRDVLETSGVKSLLAAPIMIDGELFGTLSLDAVGAERSWSDDEVSLVTIVAEVFANALGRKRSADVLSERLAHETLLSDLSAAFVNLPVERIDEEIQRGMGRIATAMDIDRGTVLQFCDDGVGVNVTHAWAAEGLKHAPMGPLKGASTWVLEHVRQGEITAISRTASLPGRSDEEKAYCRREGIKSVVVIPVGVAGETLGALAFSSIREERTWSDEVIQRLRLMGEIFANALLRKRSEKALIASERNYREIFNAANDGTFVHDPETGAILDVNAGVLDMLGYTYEELLQLSIGDLSMGTLPYSQEEAIRWVRRAIEEGPQSFEWLVRRKDGECFWAEVDLRESNIGGQPRVLSVVRDITERKQAEKAAERHRVELARAWHVNALGEMASGLAHELNQPLCAILNYANGCLRLTRKRELPKAALKESIKEVIGQAERAGDIVKRVRGLVGKREPRCVKLDVKALLSDTMGMIEKEAAKHDVTVISEFKGRLPKVQADDVEIEQVALNLMRNAIEAMGDEKVSERTLTIATSRPEKGTIEVAIKDTGRGLSPEVSERVFDSFFTTKQHGLGIGLSLSRRIVEAHGGRLWAESDGCSGTTFRFTLPVVGAPHGKHRVRSVRR